MNYGHRFDKRPWPVSPREYPLSGPTTGPVYTPPPTFGRRERHGALYWFSVALVAAFIVLGVAAPVIWPDMLTEPLYR